MFPFSPFPAKNVTSSQRVLYQISEQPFREPLPPKSFPRQTTRAPLDALFSKDPSLPLSNIKWLVLHQLREAAPLPSMSFLPFSRCDKVSTSFPPSVPPSPSRTLSFFIGTNPFPARSYAPFLKTTIPIPNHYPRPFARRAQGHFSLSCDFFNCARNGFASATQHSPTFPFSPFQGAHIPPFRSMLGSQNSPSIFLLPSVFFFYYLIRKDFRRFVVLDVATFDPLPVVDAARAPFESLFLLPFMNTSNEERDY